MAYCSVKELIANELSSIRAEINGHYEAIATCNLPIRIEEYDLIVSVFDSFQEYLDVSQRVNGDILKQISVLKKRAAELEGYLS